MYAHFNDLHSSLSVFNTLPEKTTTYLWNLIIKTHVDSGQSVIALYLYKKMRVASVPHDTFTFPLVNRAISSLDKNCLMWSQMIHSVAMKIGLGENLYFCNTLIELYVKNCCNLDARKVFDEMPERDLISWTSMISCYVWVGDVFESFRLFSQMRMEGLEPNEVTLVIMLKGCCVVQGRGLHCYVIKKGLQNHPSVGNSILSMYGKKGSIEETQVFFSRLGERDVVSWNIMISAYSFIGDALKVVEIFNEMVAEVIPSVETLTSAISGFAKSGSLLQGEKLHGYTIKTGVFDVVLHTSLIDLYAKCGELRTSLRLFDEVPQRNNITWSTMMSGLVQNGYFAEAIELFRRMQTIDVKPGVENVRSLVLAYTHLGALQLGKVVHGFVIRNSISSFKENTAMGTSFLSMYAKCGSIVSARRCFDQMRIKDVVTWSSMIEAYSSHGLGFEATVLLDQMVGEGVEPNCITFLSLLSACSHSGLVDEGYWVFNCMSRQFGLKPDLNHYTCMVDLLGRSGKLEEALAMIENMVIEPDSRIWGALLSASKIYSNNKIGVYTAQRLLELENDNAGYHTLLSNVHASEERWDEVETVRKVMTENCLKKLPGWSSIESRGLFHGFVAKDRSHPQIEEICEILHSLNKTRLEELG